jgi:hypothetical protein
MRVVYKLTRRHHHQSDSALIRYAQKKPQLIFEATLIRISSLSLTRTLCRFISLHQFIGSLLQRDSVQYFLDNRVPNDCSSNFEDSTQLN